MKFRRTLPVFFGKNLVETVDRVNVPSGNADVLLNRDAAKTRRAMSQAAALQHATRYGDWMRVQSEQVRPPAAGQTQSASQDARPSLTTYRTSRALK